MFLYLGVSNVSISCNIIKVKNLQEKIPVVEMRSMPKNNVNSRFTHVLEIQLLAQEKKMMLTEKID